VPGGIEREVPRAVGGHTWWRTISRIGRRASPQGRRTGDRRRPAAEKRPSATRPGAAEANAAATALDAGDVLATARSAQALRWTGRQRLARRPTTNANLWRGEQPRFDPSTILPSLYAKCRTERPALGPAALFFPSGAEKVSVVSGKGSDGMPWAFKSVVDIADAPDRIQLKRPDGVNSMIVAATIFVIDARKELGGG